MSKFVLPFIQGSALSGSVATAVTQVLAKTAPVVELFPVKHSLSYEISQLVNNSKGIAIGSALTSEEISQIGQINSVVTTTTQLPIANLSPDYSNAKVTLVRAITSDPSSVAIRFRDRVDIFPAQGVCIDEETKVLLSTFRSAAQRTLELARSVGRVTIVTKPLSRYEKLNELFLQASKEVFENSNGITVEVVNTSQLFNELIMFPEKYGVILANDVQSSDSLEGILTGIVGGAGVCQKTLYGEGMKLFVGASDINPSATIFAAASALADIGLAEESKKTLNVLSDALKVAGNRTSDLEGGKLDVADFTKNLCA